LFCPNAELAIIAILLGGVAIWTMHFVGMSSCVLKYRDVDIVSPIYYRIGLTFASLVAVIVLCFIGKDPTNVVAAMSFS
jgi:NO-binding membrane sensor protein with MHYT domain